MGDTLSKKLRLLAAENKWGQTEVPTKTIDDLFDEVIDGDSVIFFNATNSKIMRKVDVLNIIILCGEHILSEDRQIFNDGSVRTRERNYITAKYNSKDANVRDAIIRALREVLGYVTEYQYLSRDEKSSIKYSKSYPGLECSYSLLTLAITIPEKSRQLVRLEKVQEKKVTYFVWKEVPVLT